MVSLTLLIAFRSLLLMFSSTVSVYVVQQTIKYDLYSVVWASNEQKVIQNENLVKRNTLEKRKLILVNKVSFLASFNISERVKHLFIFK